MKNIEFYKDELSGLLNPDMMYFFALDHGVKCVLKINPDTRKGNIDMKLFIEWLLEEHQILNDVEKRYLKNIIRPLRTEHTYVQKRYCDYNGAEYIKIGRVKGYVDGNTESIEMPYFEAGTMYKGMKRMKAYKLEELGL